MKPSKVERLRKAVDDQVKWMQQCGGDLAGYLTNYGFVGTYKLARIPSNGEVCQIPAWYGEGGKAIYDADCEHLAMLRKQLVLAAAAEARRSR